MVMDKILNILHFSCPEPEEGKKLKVTMVAWDASDRYCITAVNDFTVSSLISTIFI